MLQWFVLGAGVHTFAQNSRSTMYTSSACCLVSERNIALASNQSGGYECCAKRTCVEHFIKVSFGVTSIGNASNLAGYHRLVYPPTVGRLEIYSSGIITFWSYFNQSAMLRISLDITDLSTPPRGALGDLQNWDNDVLLLLQSAMLRISLDITICLITGSLYQFRSETENRIFGKKLSNPQIQFPKIKFFKSLFLSLL